MTPLWIPLFLSALLDDPARGWLETHAVPLATVAPGSGFDDLRPLGEHLRGARVVALGECTHGSREVFQLKHRLLEYLVAEQGFTVFGIEASMPDTLNVDAYVRGADLDLNAVVRGMGFWTWSTEEVAAMASWMRAENQRREVPLQWWGFDLQRPQSAVDRLAILLAHDPALEQVEALQLGLGGQGFAATGLTLPGEVVAGRTLVLSGRIRTRDLENGWAGLWARADGTGPRALELDNMYDRGPRGTRGWRTYTLEMQVPAEAERVVFGIVQSGQGEAWYDDLSLTLDGVAWTPPEGVDLRFARWEPANVDDAAQSIQGGAQRWVAGGEGYAITHDPERQVLHISGGRPPAEVRAMADQLAEELEARGGTDPTLALAGRLARTVAQGINADKGGRYGSAIRDRAMADNVLWLLEHTDAKLVLWAHNFHVSRRDLWMGAHLAEALGDAYLPIGFACGSGTYTAMDMETGVLGEHPLTPPPADSVEARLGAYGQPRLLIDLRETAGEPAASWLREPLRNRDIGAAAMDRQFARARLPEVYDLLVYLDQTTAAVQLPVKGP